MASLTPETFLAVADMIAGHLRLKEADRWSPHICRLKFFSFTSEFPEISEAQFMWAAEQWIQGTDASAFLRYPTWGELMAALYRTEGGRANRSWGPRDELPPFVRFKPDQLALLPTAPRPLAPPPDDRNVEAYRTVGRAGEAEAQGLPLKPAEEHLLPPAVPGLTDEQWQAYLEQVDSQTLEEAPCNS
jgi:hypothetical protein